MESSKLRLVKIEYDMTVEELDLLLYRRMSEEDKRWAAVLSIQNPNESVVDENEMVHDLILIDFDIQDRIDKMLNELHITFVMTDVSESYYLNPNTFSTLLQESIDTYLKNYIDIDSVLDRIKEVGLNNINVFEKKFLDISYGSTTENTQV
jgi:hypothetical protein